MKRYINSAERLTVEGSGRSVQSENPKKKLMHHLTVGDIGAGDVVSELLKYVDDSDVVDILDRLGL